MSIDNKFLTVKINDCVEPFNLFELNLWEFRFVKMLSVSFEYDQSRLLPFFFCSFYKSFNIEKMEKFFENQLVRLASRFLVNVFITRSLA